jgi:hypothetical protein
MIRLGVIKLARFTGRVVIICSLGVNLLALMVALSPLTLVLRILSTKEEWRCPKRRRKFIGRLRRFATRMEDKLNKEEK